VPNVIYEPFNEPMPRAFAGGQASEQSFDWSNDFKPYHEQIVAAIRAEDPNGIIVMGTPYWSQNVDEAVMDPVQGDNLMYTVHFYACTHTQWLRDRAQTALDLGFPVFVTEWGATEASGNGQICPDEADRWHQFMDDNMISWAAWKLDDRNDASSILAFQAPAGGPWTNWVRDDGHGPYVVEKLLEPPAQLPGGLPGSASDAGSAAPQQDTSLDAGTDARAEDGSAADASGTGKPAPAKPVIADAASPSSKPSEPSTTAELDAGKPLDAAATKSSAD